MEAGVDVLGEQGGEGSYLKSAGCLGVVDGISITKTPLEKHPETSELKTNDERDIKHNCIKM